MDTYARWMPKTWYSHRAQWITFIEFQPLMWIVLWLAAAIVVLYPYNYFETAQLQEELSRLVPSPGAQQTTRQVIFSPIGAQIHITYDIPAEQAVETEQYDRQQLAANGWALVRDQGSWQDFCKANILLTYWTPSGAHPSVTLWIESGPQKSGSTCEWLNGPGFVSGLTALFGVGFSLSIGLYGVMLMWAASNGPKHYLIARSEMFFAHHSAEQARLSGFVWIGASLAFFSTWLYVGARYLFGVLHTG